MTSLPTWYPDANERKPAPMPLLLVQAFLNTLEIEAQTDVLADPHAARAWFVAAGLLPPKAPLRPADLELARGLRESVRGLLASDHGERLDERQLDPLRELVKKHRLRITIDDSGALAVENSSQDELADGLFGLLLIIHAAQQNGSWTRLKACGNGECQWVFYDRSKNQHGNWCDMAVCGNRLKNRELRARRR